MTLPASPRTGDFEVYLLTRMRGEHARAALARRNVDATAVAAEVAELGIEEPTCPIERYEELLGEPERRSPSTGIDPEGPFAGSVAWRWSLPTWPRTPFVVNAHPQGWSWVTGFVRASDPHVPPPRLPELRPWQWLRGEIAAAMPTAVFDGWGHQVDLRAEGPGGRVHLLRFDYELLQSVEPLGPQSL